MKTAGPTTARCSSTISGPSGTDSATRSSMSTRGRSASAETPSATTCCIRPRILLPACFPQAWTPARFSTRAGRSTATRTTRSDTAIPLHRVTFNGIVEVPVGKGKRFLGNTNKLLECAGGRLPDGVRRHGGVAGLPGGLGKLGRHQPGRSVQEARPGHRLPQRRLPSGLSVVQRLHLADRDQRRQERGHGCSRQLHAVPRSHQQYSRHGEFRQQQRDRHAEERQQVVTGLLARTGGRQPVLADRPAGPKNFTADMSLYKDLLDSPRGSSCESTWTLSMRSISRAASIRTRPTASSLCRRRTGRPGRFSSPPAFPSRVFFASACCRASTRRQACGSRRHHTVGP